MSNDVVIDPALLATLGARRAAVPVDRPGHVTKSQGIIKPYEPPKVFEVDMRLKVPGQ